ncbi:CAS5 [Candida jiufengensis]|uniref:CAS5 n=1 Tax=Candida jiufengensis TaxID=497108 RepID=UPI0022241051|nr:CAS5 [Candida jiufengensis]KAI5955149.1 CAS5 [Candida jiufengensis]
MDKFLLSSPTQLAQQYDESTLNFDIYDQTVNLQHNQYQQQFINNNNSINNTHFNSHNNNQFGGNLNRNDDLIALTLNNSQNFNSQNQLQQHEQQQQQQQQSTQQIPPLYSQNINLQEKQNYYTSGGNNNNNKQIYNNNDTPMLENEVVPISTNLPDNKFFITDDSGLGINVLDTSNMDSTNLKFNHSRNISLDETMSNFNHSNYRQNKYNHQHNHSIVSINQDAPINDGSNLIPNSFSSNTIYSLDSIPSFESPNQQYQQQIQNSLPYQQQQQYQQNQTYQQQHHHQQQHSFTSTPRRAGRNKSMSVSSYNTPMRNCAPSFSPINLATTAFNKVSKTPAKLTKGHARSRSKVSLDAAAAALASKTNSASSYNSSALNPFYTPSQLISSFDDENEDDVNSTPLLTPGSYKLKSSQSTFFSPYKQNTDNSYLNPNNIDNQENDAVKQLKKAKSYSNLFRKQKKEQQLQQQQQQQQFTMQRPQPVNSFSEASISGMLSRPAPKIDLLSPEFKQELDSTTFENDDKSIQTFNPSITSPFNNYVTQNNSKKSFSNSVEYSQISLNLDNSIEFDQQQQDDEYDQEQQTDHHTEFTSSTSTSNTTPSLLPPMVTFSTKDHRQTQPAQEEEIKKESISSKPKSKPTKSKRKSPKSKTQDSEEEKSNTSLQSSEESTTTTTTTANEDDTVTIPIPENLNVTRPKVRNNRSDKEHNKTDPKKKHKCPICESRFQRPEHVKRHLKSHSSEKPFQCEEINCGKCFNRKDNLKAHLKKIHGKLNV